MVLSRWQVELDYETQTSHVISVLASSTDGSESTADFTITIEDVDEYDISSIADTDGASNEVSEDASIGTLVGIMAYAEDLDASDNVSYTLSDDAGGLFTIDSETGVVTLAGQLDYENETSHSVTVLASSTDGSTSSSDFTIEVLDDVSDNNDYGITAIIDVDDRFNEARGYDPFGLSSFGQTNITAYAEDLDASDSVSYSLSDDVEGLFEIDSETGIVFFNYSPDLNAEKYSITVLATSTDFRNL